MLPVAALDAILVSSAGVRSAVAFSTSRQSIPVAVCLWREKISSYSSVYFLIRLDLRTEYVLSIPWLVCLWFLSGLRDVQRSLIDPALSKKGLERFTHVETHIRAFLSY